MTDRNKLKRLAPLAALVIVVLLAVLVGVGSDGDGDSVPSGDVGSSEANRSDVTSSDYSLVSDSPAASENEADLDELKNTENFLPSAIEHIFEGTVNKKGEASGYHYDGIEGTAGEIIDGTKSAPDKNGVYEAQVTVNGIKKSGNGGYSTFYPEDLSPQEVVDMINEAYENREHIGGNTYAGVAGDIEIDMYLTDDGMIISAFPIKED